MIVKTLVKKNAYYDSVTLMIITNDIKKLDGVEEVLVGMGTDHNISLAKDLGLFTKELEDVTANDLIISMKVKDEGVFSEAVSKVEELLSAKQEEEESEEVKPQSIDSAMDANPDANLVLISVPGQFAAREARKALMGDRHVHLFSDNVTIEEELELKKLAHERGLLVMGPDCGTAIINGVALAFANVVTKGPIGIVAASGTGAQETSTIIAKNGSGITQLIGTGGRDLKESIGGIMMIDGIKALAEDPDTKVILLVSKPPAESVARKVLEVAKDTGKPVVVHFIGGTAELVSEYGLVFSESLEDAALKAVALSKGEAPKDAPEFSIPEEKVREIVEKETKGMKPEQKYIRGLYSGGTLCDEAMLFMTREFGGVYSNAPLSPEFKLEDSLKSKEHTVIDLGEDEFTVGRPHPMIDSTLRSERIIAEAKDPEVAVILLDVVLGYGSNPDPAGSLLDAIKKAKKEADADGRYLSIVASVCGTEEDPQPLSEQVAKLESAGVVVMPSNIQAVRMAMKIAKRG